MFALCSTVHCPVSGEITSIFVGAVGVLFTVVATAVYGSISSEDMGQKFRKLWVYGEKTALAD